MMNTLNKLKTVLRGLCHARKSLNRNTSAFITHQERRQHLFKLLKTTLDIGNELRPINEIGSCVGERRPAIFIKHDIHGLNLKSLVEFASTESQLGIRGTYFFMAPNHPDTLSYYDFSAQSEVMKSIQELGHEIGLHLDPYFLMQHHQQSLDQVLKDCLSAFRDIGLNVQSMNMHGNTGHKHRDKNGYGTSFELFEEIARQPDFPSLEAMHADSADMVRQNRVRLKDYGISFWADMPIWTADYGYIVTNFISDNGLGKSGRYELLTHEETANQYAISRYQPPGARNRTQPDRIVACEGKTSLVKFGNWKLAFESAEFESLFDTRPFTLQPAQILLHPQFYCD
jgi:hypothetical protein